eukprot:Gb_26578 [translate_table: standard]
MVGAAFIESITWYFLANTVVEELTFGWPRQMEDQFLRQQISMRLHAAILAVGLSGIPLDLSPKSLSDGFKRRLALAVQLESSFNVSATLKPNPEFRQAEVFIEESLHPLGFILWFQLRNPNTSFVAVIWFLLEAAGSDSFFMVEKRLKTWQNPRKRSFKLEVWQQIVRTLVGEDCSRESQLYCKKMFTENSAACFSIKISQEVLAVACDIRILPKRHFAVVPWAVVWWGVGNATPQKTQVQNPRACSLKICPLNGIGKRYVWSGWGWGWYPGDFDSIDALIRNFLRRS